MDEHAILQAIHDSWAGETVRQVPWLFSSFESIHFIGLCLLMGALLIADLRLLGWIRAVPIRSALHFTHIAVAGFALNLISGLGFFCSDPFNYWENPAFKVKMALVVIAGCNVLWFEFAERPKVRSMAPDADTDIDTKLVAGLSLALWTVILILGRLLPSFGQNG